MSTNSSMSHNVRSELDSPSNTAQVSGGERELRTAYLKPFNRACVESLAIMTAYSSYDGIPAIANKRTFLRSRFHDTILTFVSPDLLTDIVSLGSLQTCVSLPTNDSFVAASH